VPPTVTVGGVGVPPVLRVTTAFVAIAEPIAKNPDGRLTVMKPPASNGATVPITNVKVDTVLAPGTRETRAKVGLVIIPPIDTVLARSEILSTVDCTLKHASA